MKKLQKRMVGLICLLLVSVLIAGCGGGSKKSNGGGGTNPPAGEFNRTFVETFDKIQTLTDISKDQSLLDNPSSFSTAYMPENTSVYVGREAGTLGLDNGDATAQGANGLRIGFVVSGLKDAPAPVLKLWIKNTSENTITLLVGNEYKASGNAGESGQRAHAVLDIPAKSDYTEYTINLNTSFTNTEIIQLRPTVLDSSNKATSTGAAGLYIDKIEVTGLPGKATDPSIKYTLNVTVEGSGTVSPENGTFDSNAEVKLTATPATGWKFSHWSGDLTGSNNPATLTMNGDKTVTAVFVEDTTPVYTLSVNETEGGSVTLSPGGGSYNAGTEVTLTANPDNGYRFKQWSGDASGTNATTTVVMDADKAVTAEFEELPRVPMPFNDNFDTATSDTFFKTTYKAMPDDSSIPFYKKTGGTVTVADGQLTIASGRFTVGDKGTATASGIKPNGAFDLTKPYIISFKIVAVSGDNTAKEMHVYVDNNTTSGGNSYHGNNSVLYRNAGTALVVGETVTITSSYGTKASFIQLRTETGLSVTIDDLTIEYQ